MQLIAVAALTLALGRVTRWLCVPWSLVLFLILLVFLLGYSWLSSYTSGLYWNCIMMREEEITEQPMKAARAETIMMNEAVSFLER